MPEAVFRPERPVTEWCFDRQELDRSKGLNLRHSKFTLDRAFAFQCCKDRLCMLSPHPMVKADFHDRSLVWTFSGKYRLAKVGLKGFDLSRLRRPSKKRKHWIRDLKVLAVNVEVN
jgi:hypothetical protein